MKITLLAVIIQLYLGIFFTENCLLSAILEVLGWNERWI